MEDEILSDIVWSVINVKILHIPVEVGTLLGAAVEMYYELGYRFAREAVELWLYSCKLGLTLRTFTFKGGAHIEYTKDV